MDNNSNLKFNKKTERVITILTCSVLFMYQFLNTQQVHFWLYFSLYFLLSLVWCVSKLNSLP